MQHLFLRLIFISILFTVPNINQLASDFLINNRHSNNLLTPQRPSLREFIHNILFIEFGIHHMFQLSISSYPHLHFLFFHPILRFIVVHFHKLAFIVHNSSINDFGCIRCPATQLARLHCLNALFRMEFPAIYTVFRTIRTTSISTNALSSRFTPTAFLTTTADRTVIYFTTELIILTVYFVAQFAHLVKFLPIQCLQHIVAIIINCEQLDFFRVIIQLFYRLDFSSSRSFRSGR